MIDEAVKDREYPAREKSEKISLMYFLANFSKKHGIDTVFANWLYRNGVMKTDLKTRKEWDSLLEKFYKE
jgi:hypothetical protein